MANFNSFTPTLNPAPVVHQKRPPSLDAASLSRKKSKSDTSLEVNPDLFSHLSPQSTSLKRAFEIQEFEEGEIPQNVATAKKTGTIASAMIPSSTIPSVGNWRLSQEADRMRADLLEKSPRVFDLKTQLMNSCRATASSSQLLSAFSQSRFKEFNLAKQNLQLDRFVPYKGSSSNGISNQRAVILNAEGLDLSLLTQRGVWPEFDSLINSIQEMNTINAQTTSGVGNKSAQFKGIEEHAKTRILLFYLLGKMMQGTHTDIGGRGLTDLQLFKGSEYDNTAACHHSILPNINETKDRTLLIQLKGVVLDNLRSVRDGNSEIEGRVIYLMLALGISCDEIKDLYEKVSEKKTERAQDALDSLWVKHGLDKAPMMDVNTLFYYLNNHTLVAPKFVNLVDDCIEKRLRHTALNVLREISRGKNTTTSGATDLGNLILRDLEQILAETKNQQAHVETFKKFLDIFDGFWKQPFSSSNLFPASNQLPARFKRLCSVETSVSGMLQAARDYNKALSNSFMELGKKSEERKVKFNIAAWENFIQLKELEAFNAELKKLKEIWPAYQKEKEQVEKQIADLDKISKENDRLQKEVQNHAITLSPEENALIQEGKAKHGWSWGTYIKRPNEYNSMIDNVDFILWRNACIKSIFAKLGDKASDSINALKLIETEAQLDKRAQHIRLAMESGLLAHNVIQKIATLEEHFEKKYKPIWAKEVAAKELPHPFAPDIIQLNDEVRTLTSQISGTQAALKILPAKETGSNLDAQIILVCRNVVPTFKDKR